MRWVPSGAIFGIQLSSCLWLNMVFVLTAEVPSSLYSHTRARCGTFLRNETLPQKRVPRFSFLLPQFPFPPPRRPATRGRGSRDLRARVTRPAGAGHTTCGRGSRDLRPRVAEKVPKRNGNVGERNGNTREPHLDCARFSVLVRSLFSLKNNSSFPIPHS